MALKMILADKKFSPFFWTQFLGAFNDNFYKNALLLLITFKGIQIMGLAPSSTVAVASGIFILPFFIFSPIAGIICDKFEKAKVIRITKVWEIFVMGLATLGFYLNNYGLLLIVLFLMGTQSAFFGPVKYSMIAHLVPHDQLTEGNAYIELGTFIAILGGTICGGIFSSFSNIYWLCLGILLVSTFGYLISKKIPRGIVGDPTLPIAFNPIPQIRDMFALVRKNRAIFNSILGISWFWFFGAGILMILPEYCKVFLGVDENVTTVFLAMFTLGIGLGSILCEKLSFRQVEIGVVPIGSLGMTIFILDIYFQNPEFTASKTLIGIEMFLNSSIGPRLLVDFFIMSVFGGIFIVPLYTLLQERSENQIRSRVIAANNIANAIFMVIASGMVFLFYAFKLSTVEIFAVFAVLNCLVAIYIYSVVPEFTLRFYSWILSHIMYRVKVKGLEHIPKNGAFILASNHVTFVDWLILAGACKRPVRFIMYYKFFQIPIVKTLFRQAKVIPIAGAKEDLKILNKAFETASLELKDSNGVCIFPEGQLTLDGKLSPIRPGILKMIEKDPVPIVPVVLKGFWGSMFSKANNRKLPSGFRRKVEVEFFAPILPENLNLNELENIYATALGETPPHKQNSPLP